MAFFLAGAGVPSKPCAKRSFARGKNAARRSFAESDAGNRGLVQNPPAAKWILTFPFARSIIMEKRCCCLVNDGKKNLSADD